MKARSVVASAFGFILRDAFTTSDEVLTEGQMDAERARTLKAWAEAEVQYGDSAKADELWDQAKEIFESLGLELEVERMRLRPGQQPPMPPRSN